MAPPNTAPSELSLSRSSTGRTHREGDTFSSIMTSSTSENNTFSTLQSQHTASTLQRQNTASTLQRQPTSSTYRSDADTSSINLPASHPQSTYSPFPTSQSYTSTGLPLMRRQHPPPPPPPPDGISETSIDLYDAQKLKPLSIVQPGLEVSDWSSQKIHVPESSIEAYSPGSGRYGFSEADGMQYTPQTPVGSGTLFTDSSRRSWTASGTVAASMSSGGPFRDPSTRAGSEMGEKFLYQEGEERHKTPRKERRICGIKRQTFLLVVAVVAALVIGAVAGAVGGVMGVKNANKEKGDMSKGIMVGPPVSPEEGPSIEVPEPEEGIILPEDSYNMIAEDSAIQSFLTKNTKTPMVVFYETQGGTIRNRTFDKEAGVWRAGKEDLFEVRKGTPLKLLEWDGPDGKEMRLYYLTPKGQLADRIWSPNRAKNSWQPGNLQDRVFDVHEKTQIAALSLTGDKHQYIWFQNSDGRIRQAKVGGGGGWEYDDVFEYPKVEPGSGLSACLGAKDSDTWIVVSTRGDDGRVITVHLSKSLNFRKQTENFSIPPQTPLHSLPTKDNIFFIYLDPSSSNLRLHGYNVQYDEVSCPGCERGYSPYLDPEGGRVVRVMGVRGEIREVGEVVSVKVRAA